MKRIILAICAIICSLSVYADNPPEKISIVSCEEDDKIEIFAQYFEMDYASISKDEIHKNLGKMMMQVIEMAMQKKSSVSSTVVDGKEIQSIIESKMSMKVNTTIVDGAPSESALVIEIHSKD